MDRYIGRLVGNTGNPSELRVALKDSFSARRGEFVRIAHRERAGEPETEVLGRIVNISRMNILYSEGLGEGLSEVEVLPSAQLTGESLFGSLELIGYKDPITDEIKIPRRPLDPGSKVRGVDYDFLSRFYEFQEDTSIHIGNLVGYERGQNVVSIFLDVNKLVTEHLAVLAMTGSGKSYTVGRIIERLVGQMNGSVVVFDPHGEYGKAFEKGLLNFAPNLAEVEDLRDRERLPRIAENFRQLQAKGGGIIVYTPQNRSFNTKYGERNKYLALQFDRFELDELAEILPGLTEPQQRVMDIAIRYWKKVTREPRDINSLLNLLTNDLDELKGWDELSDAEAKALSNRSAAVAAMRLRRAINEAQSFYTAAVGEPTDVRDIVGRKGDRTGRLVIVDLQGLSDLARQIIVALFSAEILRAASDKLESIRPTFLVYEEGHNFAPAGTPSVSRNIIKKIAGEGRKFGVGFAIISQRPSKLDSDVTSQCNTIITMRIKNPDDQRFITKSSDMFSQADVNELPTLSTGEALICGRSIPAPLLVKVGTKVLRHGGVSPEVLHEWAPAELDKGINI